ncbi:hypothetical protein [Streptomyces marianii]
MDLHRYAGCVCRRSC